MRGNLEEWQWIFLCEYFYISETASCWLPQPSLPPLGALSALAAERWSAAWSSEANRLSPPPPPPSSSSSSPALRPPPLCSVQPSWKFWLTQELDFPVTAGTWYPQYGAALSWLAEFWLSEGSWVFQVFCFFIRARQSFVLVEVLIPWWQFPQAAVSMDVLGYIHLTAFKICKQSLATTSIAPQSIFFFMLLMTLHIYAFKI